jgi:uncharacterized protein with PIN domain
MEIKLICPHCNGEIIDAFESNTFSAVVGGVLMCQAECLQCHRQFIIETIYTVIFEPEE